MHIITCRPVPSHCTDRVCLAKMSGDPNGIGKCRETGGECVCLWGGGGGDGQGAGLAHVLVGTLGCVHWSGVLGRDPNTVSSVPMLLHHVGQMQFSSVRVWDRCSTDLLHGDTDTVHRGLQSFTTRGVVRAGISAIQILCESFVRNVFGVFNDLHVHQQMTATIQRPPGHNSNHPDPESTRKSQQPSTVSHEQFLGIIR